MSGLFGGNKPRPSGWQTPVLAGLQIQKTGYSQPVPIVYGTARVSPTLMYYTDWQVHPHTSSQSTGGGKGGGGGGSITTTTYTMWVRVPGHRGPQASVACTVSVSVTVKSTTEAAE